MTPNPFTLPANLGYRILDGLPALAVCAWCLSKEEVEAEALRLNLRVTHSICGPCAQRQFGMRLGEAV